MTKPVLPLSADEQALYGDELGTYFLDANFTPDVPRAAALWGARWEERFGGTVDGIFTLDPVTLSYLLEATGPVTVSGVELGAGNVIEVVESSVYLNQPDPALQDEFLNDVAKKVFDTFAAGRGDQVGVIRALVRGVDEGRVRIHSFDEDDQAVVAGTTIAGELLGPDPRRPQVGVYLNDGTGSKMSYYLDYEVDVAAVGCTRDRQRLLGRMRITSDTPSDVASLPQAVTGYDGARAAEVERGQQVVVTHVMAPRGAEIGEVTLDGERLDQPVLERLGDRRVLPLSLLLSPGQTHDLTWRMSTAPGQDSDVDVSVTPGRHPETESSVVPTAC